MRDSDTLFLWLSTDGTGLMADLRCIQGYPDVFESAWPGLSNKAQAWIESIPERRQPKSYKQSWSLRNRHRLGLTDTTAKLIDDAWPRKQIQFRMPGCAEGNWTYPEDDTARLHLDVFLARSAVLERRASMVARFKLHGELPPNPSDWRDVAERPLAPHQKLVAQLVSSHESLALFADMGTGKTAPCVNAACLRAIRKRRAEDKMAMVLVVCPGQVRYNWAKEFERFATVTGKVSILDGTALERLKRFHSAIVDEPDCAFSAVVVGYDTAPSMVEHLARIGWDLLIADESHKFKGPTTLRWKTMRRLRDCAKARVAATGSPIGNTVFDLWTQLEFCGEGLSGFSRFEAFRQYYGKWRDLGVGFGIQKLIGLKNIPLLQERLSRVSFQITKVEAGLNLPDKVYDYREVRMTEHQAAVYKAVSEQLVIQFESALEGQMNSLMVNNVLTQLLRLAQVTSGHITWDAIIDQETGDLIQPKRVEPIATPNPKVEAVLEMLEETEGKAIVWCAFRADIEALAARFSEAGVGFVEYHGGIGQKAREDAQHRFNHDPRIKAFVCNPQTAGEGMNLVGYDWDKSPPVLETYTDHEIFFSCGWSATERSQAEDRAHRRGTKMPVRITDLIVPGTIDEEIRERIRSKQEMAQLTLDISNILKTVLKL